MQDNRCTLQLMGTVINIWVKHDTPDNLLNDVTAQLIDYEKRFSANDADSELMQLNKQAGRHSVKVSKELFELIKLGKEQSLIADSFLNIAIGPLIKAWRIGFTDAHYPKEEKIKALLPLVDPTGIHLNDKEQTVYLDKKGMEIDLGALAKGYFADAVIQFMKEKGATAGYIDLGGNIRTYGSTPGRSGNEWRVGIQNPFLPRGNYAAVLAIQGQSVVTSGIYERKFEWQGETYHHIFDDQTGYPVKTDIASITIVSKQSIDGEIWTTRLFGKSAVEAITQLNRTNGIEGIVITQDGQLASSEGLKSRLILS
ncbi:MAG: FAD:protein FMN transferase [Enterococcus sp.]